MSLTCIDFEKKDNNIKNTDIIVSCVLYIRNYLYYDNYMTKGLYY